MRRTIILLATLLLASQIGFGHGKASKPSKHDAREIEFPDTEEYLTLVLDPHTHSVFSDGHVWPRIRVEEALRDGLDAFAVTEHLEYQPHLEDIPHPDRNRSFHEASDAAEDSELIVIPGAEITRQFPAGHMNAIFIQDANLLFQSPEVPDPFDTREYARRAELWPAQRAVEAANEQGAFVFWNHAYWTRDFPNGIAVMPQFHLENIQAGLLHGVEVANGSGYSQETFQMALDHNLTLIGVSDIHGLIDWDYEPHEGGHRPVTLVLAREKTAESMKEALFDRRTVVWFKNHLIGRQEHLMPLLQASLKLEDASYGDGEILEVTITNVSDADFQLQNKSEYGFYGHIELITVPHHGSETIRVKTGSRVDVLALEFEVLNAYTAPKTNAILRLEAEVE